MSYATMIARAATQAQRQIAKMHGMTGETNTTLADGTECIGVYGQPQVIEVPLDSGGFRRRVEVPLTITRAQLTAPPTSQTKLTRTDLSPNVRYRIESVDTHDPLHYVLTLVLSGE